MASITVDVDLGDFDLDELLDEIINRSFYPLYKQDIEDWAKDMFDIDPFNENRKLSLLDQIKIDFLMDNLDKIKLNDLENLI